MAAHNDLGRWGEELALSYLLEWNYTILEKNWRFSHAEIDVIARKEKQLVFVEVKTRGSDKFGPPEAFLNYKKRRLMFEAANVFMEEIGFEGEIRFDVISILTLGFGGYHLKHFEDAFFPGLK